MRDFLEILATMIALALLLYATIVLARIADTLAQARTSLDSCLRTLRQMEDPAQDCEEEKQVDVKQERREQKEFVRRVRAAAYRNYRGD